MLERQSSGKHTLQYFEDKESSKDQVNEIGVVDLSTLSNVRSFRKVNTTQEPAAQQPSSRVSHVHAVTSAWSCPARPYDASS